MPLDQHLKIYAPTPLDPMDYGGIKAALDADGVCVVQDILSAEEQQQFLDLFWDSIGKRSKKLKRDDSSTWTAANTDWYGTFGAGQYKHYGMAQEAHCWLVRGNKKIRNIFEKGLYAQRTGTDEGGVRDTPCCVSLDGCAAMFRPAVSGLKLHVDLVPNIPGGPRITLGQGEEEGASSAASRPAAAPAGVSAAAAEEEEEDGEAETDPTIEYPTVYQAAYHLYEVRVLPGEQGAPSTAVNANAGFVCVVGSHRRYEDDWRRRMRQPGFVAPKKHWNVQEEDSETQQQCSLILSPPNSYVIWRSDLLHKNYGGDADYSSAATAASGAQAAATGVQAMPRLARLSQFVTFYPSAFRSEKVLEKKIDATLKGCAMNHWAAFAHGNRVPIVAFPAWSAHAKATPSVLPDWPAIEAAVTGSVSSESSAAETCATTTAADADAAEPGKKKRKVAVGKKCALPQCFLDLL